MILFCCTKNIRLNSTHYIVIKILHKVEFQQITFNHLSDISFKGLMNILQKPYSFLVIESTFALDNPLRFRKNFPERIQKMAI